MRLNLNLNRFSLTVAVGLTLTAISARADVLVSATLTDVAAGAGVFDYTMTLNNIGTESIESLWIGWIPGVFDIATPSNPGNNLGWSSGVADGASLQYRGSVGTLLASGLSGMFTFDSTSTPAQFMSDAAGDSTVYGPNAVNGQLSFTLSPPDTETFNATVVAVPEPTTMISGTMLLLPFGGSALRILRRRQVA
jgi:hypothetical protein